MFNIERFTATVHEPTQTLFIRRLFRTDRCHGYLTEHSSGIYCMSDATPSEAEPVISYRFPDVTQRFISVRSRAYDIRAGLDAQSTE